MLGNNGNSTVETRYGKAAWTSIISGNVGQRTALRLVQGPLLRSRRIASSGPPTGPLYITVAGATVGAAQAYPRTYPSEKRFQIVDNYQLDQGRPLRQVRHGFLNHRRLDESALQRRRLATATPTLTKFARISPATPPALQELHHLHAAVRQSHPGHPHHRNQLVCAGHLEGRRSSSPSTTASVRKRPCCRNPP